MSKAKWNEIPPSKYMNRTDYQCPNCGSIWNKAVEVCPTCGQEFEVEEHEEHFE